MIPEVEQGGGVEQRQIGALADLDGADLVPQAKAAGGGPITEAPLWILTMTWVAVLANFWFGFDSSLPMQLASSSAEEFLRHQP